MWVHAPALLLVARVGAVAGLLWFRCMIVGYRLLSLGRSTLSETPAVRFLCEDIRLDQELLDWHMWMRSYQWSCQNNHLSVQGYLKDLTSRHNLYKWAAWSHPWLVSGSLWRTRAGRASRSPWRWWFMLLCRLSGSLKGSCCRDKFSPWWVKKIPEFLFKLRYILIPIQYNSEFYRNYKNLVQIIS